MFENIKLFELYNIKVLYKTILIEFMIWFPYRFASTALYDIILNLNTRYSLYSIHFQALLTWWIQLVRKRLTYKEIFIYFIWFFFLTLPDSDSKMHMLLWLPPLNYLWKKFFLCELLFLHIHLTTKYFKGRVTLFFANNYLTEWSDHHEIFTQFC